MRNFTANHQLPENVLLAYASGSLPEAFSLVVACHVSMCDESRATLMGLEAMGGMLLEQGDAVDMSADALEKTFAMIDGGSGQESRAVDSQANVPSINPSSSIFPEPLRAYVGGGPEAVAWTNVGGGVKQAVLPCGGDAKARLLHIEGGTAVPDHGHRGMELTLVLQGAFTDDLGRFARGDVEARDGAQSHKPIAEAGEACICLAATDAPLRFDGIIPRLIQPFVRI